MKKGHGQSGGPAPQMNRVLTVSNALSLFRLLLTVPVIVLLAEPYTNRMAILGIALIAYLSDLADGFIARTFEVESAAGRILDPLADKILVGGAAAGLLAAGMLPLWYVLVVIVRDVVIFLLGMHLRRRTGILVQSNMTGKAAVVSIGVILVTAMFRDSISNTTFSLLLVVSLGFLTASAVVYGERFVKLLKTASR